jgi:hypothetical protein
VSVINEKWYNDRGLIHEYCSTINQTIYFVIKYQNISHQPLLCYPFVIFTQTFPFKFISQNKDAISEIGIMRGM